MNQKINLHLFVLLSAAMLLGGCKLVNSVGSTTSSAATNSTTTSNATSPPSRETQIDELKNKAKDLMLLGTTTKLDPKAKIKGKIAIVRSTSAGYYYLEGFNSKNSTYDESGLEVYGIAKEDLAINADEIDTLAQIACDKGKKIAVYHTTDDRTIDAFARDCKVSFVNYKNKTVFAQKNFVSKELDKEIKVLSGMTERIAYIPTKEIGKYFKTLQSR